MPVSLGGFVVSSVTGPFYAALSSPSMFYATVFLVAIVVLAYLTNPSESSFRTFLTELSFRHHLTRLDDSSVSKDSVSRASSVYFTARHSQSHNCRTDSPHTLFHFANRASLVIRTPSHVHHNFGLFTVAFVVPSHAARSSPDLDMAFADAWFLGAFGNWWRGGALYAWWVDAVTRSNDEETSESGVLKFKNLDVVDEYNVLPFSSFQAKASRASPPKLRHQRQQQDSHAPTQHLQHRPPPSRSTTPPPLPKSVSLPLHATRHPSTIAQSHSLPSNSPSTSSSANSTSVSTNMFDQSPAIADLLRQIAASRSAVHELHSQLDDFQIISSQQREVLHQDLEVQRERKREEDSTRVELKSKTKQLEDSKRNAESSKRDVDRRLKSLETRRDETVSKLESLNAEISISKEKMEEDLRWIRRETEGQGDLVDGETDKGEAECLEDELTQKKAEIKAVEDVVAALSVRAKDLEDKVAEEKERLKVLEEAHQPKPHRREAEPEREALASQNNVLDVSNEAGLPWPPAHPCKPSPALSIHSSDRSSRPLVELDVPPLPNHQPSPRSKTLSLTNPPISGLGLASGNKDHRPTLTSFAPFEDMSPMPSMLATEGGLSTPVILVPSSGIKSLAGRVSVEMDLSRSTPSEKDPFIIQDWSSPSGWRGNSGGPGVIPMAHSSVSGPRLFDDVPYEPGRVGSKDYPDLDFRPSPSPSRLNSLPPSPDALDLQRAFLRAPGRANSEPQVPNSKAKELMLPRRWFSVKERKSLNPQAEEFNLKSPNPFLQHRAGVPASFDALNPSITNLAASTRSSSSNNTAARSPFFSKAFAPSPAERAALGMGTLNASLEKLPSLSDVGSLNSSPAHVHAAPAVVSLPVVSTGPEVESSFTRSMAWLNALPRRKPKFSPWEDDEH